ncbi:MAG: hypothetical protein AB7U73_06725 [Pirellulales bacterium]
MVDLCVLTAGRLRLRFLRRGDRIAHVIELDRDGKLIELLASREGSPDERWPASPPVQELELAQSPRVSPAENRAQIAWLIGRAGASHWSASVEAQAEGAITFDVACRLTEEPAWLGSRYHLMGDTFGGRPAIDALDGCHQIPSAEGSEIVIAADISQGKLPRTVRWRYRITWSQ